MDSRIFSKNIFLFAVFLISSVYCIGQNEGKIVYLKRYNASVNTDSTRFIYNRKIKGVADLVSKSTINIYGKETEGIKSMKEKIEPVDLDSIYLPKLDTYLYTAQEKVGHSEMVRTYFCEIIIKKDTISAIALQRKDDEQIKKEILAIISSVKIGDVVGDIFYNKNFEFRRSDVVGLRHCKSYRSNSGIKLTNTGAEFSSGSTRTTLLVKSDSTDQTIEAYIDTEQKSRMMETKGVVSTEDDGDWTIVLTNNSADTTEAAYEYLLKKDGLLFIAKYTASPNIFNYRKEIVETYLATFNLKE